jgi:mono/diheme cytochrome c family protein
MKKFVKISALSLIFFSCSTAGNKEENKTTSEGSESTVEDNPVSEDGVGKFKNVELPAGLDDVMADGGLRVFDVKCSACHKLNEEKLVGPGWKGVTSRRRPAWIMNFVTNTEEMLDKDPAAQAQLEICLVRMPNQSLTDDDARNVLEYMRKNDGVK